MPPIKYNPNNPVRDAIRQAGGVVRVARECGVSLQAVTSWGARGWVTRKASRLKLAKLAGVEEQTLDRDLTKHPIYCPHCRKPMRREVVPAGAI